MPSRGGGELCSAVSPGSAVIAGCFGLGQSRGVVGGFRRYDQNGQFGAGTTSNAACAEPAARSAKEANRFFDQPSRSSRDEQGQVLAAGRLG